MSFKRSLVKFATVLSVFFTGISFINVPLQTQTVQAASQSKTEKRNAVVQLAKEQVGKSYVYGATGPSAFDCSGLAQYVYKKAAKKTLPRTTYGQVTKGKRVSLSHLKKATCCSGVLPQLLTMLVFMLVMDNMFTLQLLVKG